MKILKFELEENGNWYIVLPEYEGSHEDLQMVAVADDLLSMLYTKNCKSIAEIGTLRILSLKVSLRPFAKSYSLEKKKDDAFGADYDCLDDSNGSFLIGIWLCNVTKFVFNGIFPSKIYFKIK